MTITGIISAIIIGLIIGALGRLVVPGRQPIPIWLTIVTGTAAANDPGKLAQIAYGLLPRDVFISVEQRPPGNLEPNEWATLRRVLDIIQAYAPAGAEPAAVFETIETALRAEYAKPIEPI